MNGVTEAMVKSVKRSLNNAIGSQVLEFSVMMTVLFEVAQLVNSRPIRRHPTNQTICCWEDPLLVYLKGHSMKITVCPRDTNLSRVWLNLFGKSGQGIIFLL